MIKIGRFEKQGYEEVQAVCGFNKLILEQGEVCWKETGKNIW